jgi:hypothetical protein
MKRFQCNRSNETVSMKPFQRNRFIEMVSPGMIASAKIAFTIIALAAASCRSLPFPDPHLEGEYGKSLKRWTRTVALYSGLETRAFVRMVYLSPEFVAGQAQELARMRAELPDQAAATLSRMREEYRQPSFFAIVYLPDRTANDWNERQSVWRIALNLGLGEQPPDRVVRYERPFNAELRALYPYLDDYSTAYLIRFPEPASTPQQISGPTAQVPAPRPLESFIPAEAHMVVAGAPGKMTFNWRLDGGQERASTGEPSEEKSAAAPKP